MPLSPVLLLHLVRAKTITGNEKYFFKQNTNKLNQNRNSHSKSSQPIDQINNYLINKRTIILTEIFIFTQTAQIHRQRS